MKKLILVEKQITQSIMNKETKYYKPDNVAPMRSYADPMRVNGIVASLVHNEMCLEGEPKINLDERNKIFKIKVNINRNNIERVKDKYPEVYDKLVALLNHPTLGTKTGTIAYPVDSQVPDWILYFVDVADIVNDNLKNFPLESIGLKRLDNDSVNYSNIITL